MTDRASSGVRNLRAMFENRGAASSPEPRGRSPAGNAATDGTNRPTSKVRASFVSVEPNCHIAKDLVTTKGISVNSPKAQRRESFSVKEDLGKAVPLDLKRVVSEEKEEREKSAAVAEAVPEQAVETRESSRAPQIHKAPGEMPNLGSIMKGSDFPEPETTERELPKTGKPPTKAGAAQPASEKVEEKPTGSLFRDAPADNPDKIVSGAQGEASLKPADPKDEAAVSGGQALQPPTEVLSPWTTTEPGPTTPRASGNKPKINGTTSTTGKSVAKKPSAISTAKPPATNAGSAKSPLPKSPAAARLPKTPITPKLAPAASAAKSPAPAKAQSKAAAPKTAAPKEAAKPPAPKASQASLRPSTATTATASAAAKARAPAAEAKKSAASKRAGSASASKDGTTTSPGGFKKPRPKSPTRPVRLPSHLTAPTASSAAKHGDDATPQKLARKPSTVSRPPPKAAPAAKKQPSRASLAASTAPTKRPASRASTQGAPDEGFLARMMRPTTSSASKTNEKPPSPPRKAPLTRAPTKPKGHESIVAKGKQKVEEVASRAREVVTNGHNEEKATNGESSNGVGANTEPTTAESVSDSAAAKEPVTEPTAVEQTETPAAEMPTAVAEEQKIH